MTGVSASFIVNVTPNVLSAGGTGLDVVALALTLDSRVPATIPTPFYSQLQVATYFGALSPEANFASAYFRGPDNSTIKPAKLYFAHYPGTYGSAGYLRSGTGILTLAQLQGLGAGTLTVTVNGTAVTSSTINLASATSYSQVAQIIQTAFNRNDASFTGVIAGTVLTASSVTGTLAVGQTVTGSGVASGTVITSLGTGSGGAGTYNISVSQTVASVAMTSGLMTVSYDSNSGTFILTSGTPGATSSLSFATGFYATPLALGSTNGGQVVAGSAATTPAATMNAIIAQTQDFVTFSTVFEPTSADCLAFAAWNNAQNNRYGYVLWDTDVTVTQVGNTSDVLYQVIAANYSGTHYIYAPNNQALAAAFVMGWAASIDFNADNGRYELAHRSQSGLVADVFSTAIAQQLEARGANFYMQVGTANASFFRYFPGSVTGSYPSFNDYIMQIWLVNAIQLASVVYFGNAKTTPYNQLGYGLLYAELSDPVNQAVSFGMIQNGVTLSASQAALINAAAGKPVSGLITQKGWYLMIQPSTASQRATHASPVITIWYTTGGNIIRLNINATEVA